MSPLFELSEVARSTVLVIGTLTAFLTGLLGIVQNDIKRVVAYSTLSQLGYMTAALGASAYAAGIFHLMTHAFFKALLFLGAGSVIIAMHHDQDIRNMGGLRRYMPWTWLCSLVGSLALIGVPGFSGFFSKDAIIEAVHHAQIPGAAFAAPLLYAGVFVTAFYSFRMYFLVFHGKERMDEHTREHLHETPAVVTVPLVLLAIPSVVIGLPAVGPLLFGGWFGGAIHVAPENDVLAHLGESFHGAWAMVMHGISQPPFWLAMGGVASAWFLYLVRPDIPERLRQGLSLPYRILERKYGFDDFNEKVLAAGGRLLGKALWRGGDAALIDGVVINGGSALIGRVAAIVRQVQTGHLYDYAFAVILGLLGLMTWVVFGG